MKQKHISVPAIEIRRKNAFSEAYWPLVNLIWTKQSVTIANLSGGLLMSDRDNSNSFMWFFAGLGFGALMGVLYAPRSGRETRDAIMNSAQEGGEYIKTRGREAKETMSQWVDRGKDVVGQQKEKISAAIDASRQAYREASEGKKGS
jgi:gas vesicle protein